MATPAADAMVLLGKVGQVEKLIEGTGNRKQFIIAEFTQQVDQALPGSAFLASVGLRRSPDFFNQLKTFLAGMTLDALPQQFTQHSDIFPELGVQLGHNNVLLN